MEEVLYIEVRGTGAPGQLLASTYRVDAIAITLYYLHERQCAWSCVDLLTFYRLPTVPVRYCTFPYTRVPYLFAVRGMSKFKLMQWLTCRWRCKEFSLDYESTKCLLNGSALLHVSVPHSYFSASLSCVADVSVDSGACGIPAASRAAI